MGRWRELRKSSNQALFASISFSRLVYALSWFSVAAIFPAMSEALHYSLQALGLLTTAFLVGAGVFQIPAGIYSARWGPKRTSLLGLAMVGASSLLALISGDLVLQLTMRFLAGVGAAFFFAPTMMMISTALGAGKPGLAIGVYNTAFNIGGGIALFAFGSVAALYGWRIPFLIIGVLAIVTLVENNFAIDGGEVDIYQAHQSKASLAPALTSRDIWLVNLSMIGMYGSYYVVTQFSVDYVQQHLGLAPQLAGLIASLALFGALIGGPVSGWIGDRLRTRRRVTTGLTALGVGLSASLLAFPNVYTSLAAEFLVGFFSSSAYTNSYVFPAEYPEIGRRNAPLAVGLMNSTSLLVGSVVAAVFASIVPQLGYSLSWSILAFGTILFIPLISLAREP